MSFGSLVVVIAILILYASTLHLGPPEIQETVIEEKIIASSDGRLRVENSWISSRTETMHEVYIEGEPFYRGLTYGRLAKEFVIRQEDHFVKQIKELVPSQRMLFLLKYIIALFNRKLDKHIPEEYLLEIYGVSLSASEDYDFIGSPYERLLNYHAAHDIGHALADYMLVGCSSFGVWEDRSSDGGLLVGRNFDFYVGDDFAREKIICFVRPSSGIPFATVSWGGMMGVVSGMNYEGLTVTINAAKSDVPRKAATPISILAREILQYASTIDEAYAIAANRKTFVSESLLIGSVRDGRCAIIEKSPKKMSLYEEDDNDIICTNHYQSELFADDANNLKYMSGSASVPRYERLEQLLNSYNSIDIDDAAEILRDRKGIDDVEVGMGSEFALNQFIAHHSIIMQPGRRKFWVSDNPYQLGEYVAFDLEEVFSGQKDSNAVNDSLKNIPADPFYQSLGYENFKRYKQYLNTISEAALYPSDTMDTYTDSLIASNPDYYYAYLAVGEYYIKRRKWDRALHYLKTALTKNGISNFERNYIESCIKKCTKQIKR